LYKFPGNDVIHALTKDRHQELRVDLERFNGGKGFAKYSNFYVGSERLGYRLAVSGYSGTIGKYSDYKLAVSGYSGTIGKYSNYKLSVSGYSGTIGK
jgi:hypothetical protein